MALVRSRVPELMDNPTLDPQAHRDALRGLARLNRVAGVDRLIWNMVAPKLLGRQTPLRFLDVATGSGDLPIELARRAKNAGLSLEIHGCDVSPVALQCGMTNATSAGFTLHTHTINVLTDSLPGSFDIAHCGLFLHHLDPPQVQHVLRQMSGAAKCVIVQDLCRTWMGLSLAYVVPRLLTRSNIVHIDAVRSVHGAYTIEEMRELAQSAGLNGATVTPARPERLILQWERAL